MRRMLFVSLVAALTVSSAISAATISAEAERAIDEFVGQFVELAMFDGTVLVDVGGEIAYERSFGFANYENRIGHDDRTRFRIASVSKTLTDAALGVLMQQGKLSPETSLAEYLPDFPSADKITIDQLVNHTAGIPHTNRQPWGDGKLSLPLDEIVSRLAALPLDYEPGTDSSYSNGGYAVAAKVLEIVGGGSFGEVLRKTVFDPLGMVDTAHVEDSRSPIARIATGYEPGAFPGERRHSRFYAVEMRPGGGSCYSTVRDMHAFAHAVFRENFVHEEHRRNLLGANEDGSFLSQGRSPGFVGKLLYDPEHDLIVVSLSNSYAVPADWARAIADLALGKEPSPTWPKLERAADTVAPDDPRLGNFEASRGFTVEIQRSNRGAMFIHDSRGESTTALVPMTDGAFLLPIYFQRCEQDTSRKITCSMLSGNERYTTEYSPATE